MKSRTLPDFCISGRAIEEVGGVVVHYFSAKNVDKENQFDMTVCRQLFMDLNRPKNEREWHMFEKNWPDGRMYASAHILISREGSVCKLVEFDKQAYHAGTSILDGRSHCNRWTLGIELVGTQDSGFTDAQYRELAKLLINLMAEYGFGPEKVAGHDTVRWAAIEAGDSKRKKYDPSGRSDGQGDNFDWEYLWELVDRQLSSLE